MIETDLTREKEFGSLASHLRNEVLVGQAPLPGGKGVGYFKITIVDARYIVERATIEVPFDTEKIEADVDIEFRNGSKFPFSVDFDIPEYKMGGPNMDGSKFREWILGWLTYRLGLKFSGTVIGSEEDEDGHTIVSIEEYEENELRRREQESAD